MNRLDELPWMRITAEGVAIVVSILLAFSIEAWWDTKQKKSEEQIILHAVLEELTGVKERAKRDLDSAIAIRNSTLQLLRATEAHVDLSNQEIVNLLEDTTWSNTPAEYQVPVLTALVSSGGLSIINDASLRLKLGAWAARFEEVSATITKDNDYLFNRTLPFYSGRGWLLEILNIADCKPGNPSACWSYGDKIELAERPDYTDIADDQELQGMLSERLLTLSDMIDFALRDLNEAIEVQIQAVRANLE